MLKKIQYGQLTVFLDQFIDKKDSKTFNVIFNKIDKIDLNNIKIKNSKSLNSGSQFRNSLNNIYLEEKAKDLNRPLK